MRGGFKTAVYQATAVSNISLEDTRADRQELHRQLHLRAHLLALFAAVPPGDGGVSIEREDPGPTRSDGGS